MPEGNVTTVLIFGARSLRRELQFTTTGSCYIRIDTSEKLYPDHTLGGEKRTRGPPENKGGTLAIFFFGPFWGFLDGIDRPPSGARYQESRLFQMAVVLQLTLELLNARIRNSFSDKIQLFAASTEGSVLPALSARSCPVVPERLGILLGPPPASPGPP